MVFVNIKKNNIKFYINFISVLCLMIYSSTFLGARQNLTSPRFATLYLIIIG